MNTLPTRNDLISLLAPGSVGAEIGVLNGDFSAELLKSNPSRLYLVDAWQHVTSGPYAKDPANVEQPGQDERYRNVVSRFKDDARVRILRERSAFAAGLLLELYRAEFDWVYIDADHSYSRVLTDLALWSLLIKPGGIIMGHDYIDNEKTREMEFGVVEAVGHFCQVMGWRLDLLTQDEWPSYVLRRK